MAIVRTATEKDILRIRELYRQLVFNPPPVGAPMPPPEEYRRVFNEMGKIPGYNLLVAEGKLEVSVARSLLKAFEECAK